jgi:hypothetical protein
MAVTTAYHYRRLRKFCELSLLDMRLATGIKECRIAAVERGKAVPNSVEKALIENFLRARLKMALEDGETE